MFDSLFARITWLDAAAISAIAAYISRNDLSACRTRFAKLAVSLAFQLCVPSRRAWASFDTETLDNLGWRLQHTATGFAAAGVVSVAVGVFLI